jgi:IclR family transcriptional regulator, mhp operon transcriptional activator
MSSYKPVTAVERAFEVLKVVNQGRNVGLQAVYEETGYHKATIIRMLETLIYMGYVAKTARSRYVPTGRTVLLSQGAVARVVRTEIFLG